VQQLQKNYKTDLVNVDAFSILMACCDLDLWPPESNQVISSS